MKKIKVGLYPISDKCCKMTNWEITPPPLTGKINKFIFTINYILLYIILNIIIFDQSSIFCLKLSGNMAPFLFAL